MRVIRFRGRREEGIKGSGNWEYGHYVYGVQYPDSAKSHTINGWPIDPETVGQYTGHNIGEQPIYEGDIIRVEEDADGIDPEDEMNWYVVTWVKEWCMFAMLHTKNEYFQYLKDGKAELDEFLFWTFPLSCSKDDPEKYFLCGNIHENPELLQK
jgi:hypothetical protein